MADPKPGHHHHAKMKPFGIVYVATHVESGRAYVGITTGTLTKRWAEHCRCAAKNQVPWAFSRAIAKHGPALFELKVVQECDSRDDLDAAEQDWIARLGTLGPSGFNMTGGGSGFSGLEFSAEHRAKLGAKSRGRVVSPETRAKMSASKKGIKQAAQAISNRAAAARGKKRSAETRAKIGAAHRGKVLSPATIEALRRAKIGFRHSEAAREKISRASARPRRKRTAEQVAAMKARLGNPVLADGQRFGSITEAASALGMTRPGVAYRIKVGHAGYERL